MTKDNAFNFTTYWYDIWQKQSKEFFASGDQYLQSIFEHDQININDHLTQIHAWFTVLKQQWMLALQKQNIPLSKNYASFINKIFNDAAELMLKEWTERNQTSRPINNLIELYELWLACCQKACEKAERTKTYQELYGDIMNSALKFWQNMASK